MLQHALESVRSPNTRALINLLIERLEAVDECVHTVTQTFEPPRGLEASFVIEMLREGMLSDTLKCRVDEGMIHVTATIRGTLDYATWYVQREIDAAIHCAQLRLSARR